MLRSAFTRCSGERTRREPEDVGGSSPRLARSTPYGSRFESRRSPREIWDQRDLIRHARRGFDSRSRNHGPVAQHGSAAPLHGEGCGFESRTVHAHVAQLEEARRPDRRQCEFESRREYVTWTWRNWKRAGPGRRRLGVRISPSRPIIVSMRAGGTGTTPGSEPGGPGSNPGLAALVDVCAVVASFDSRVGLLREWGFLRFSVAGSIPVVPSGRSSVERASPPPSGSQVDLSIPGQLRRTGFLLR